MTDTLRPGAAPVDITPALGTHLSGSGMGEQRPALAVLDPLYARAVVLACGDRRACLVTLGATIVTADYTDRIRAGIAAATGVPPAAIVVHAVQTHSAPSPGYFMLDPDLPLRTTPAAEYLRGAAYERGGHEANEDVTYWAKLAPGSLERVVDTELDLL